MILYKYLPLEGGKDIIEHLRIKVSNVKDFNDPFDSRVSISEPSPEQIEQPELNNEDSLQHIYKIAILEGVRVDKSYKLFKKRIQDPLIRQEVAKKLAKTLPEKLRDALKQFLENQHESLISCFCSESAKPQDEILMWAHYTSNHTGMRIAFDSEYFKGNGISTIEIDYKTERVLLDPLSDWQKEHELIIEALKKASREKSRVWSYENEYRLFVLLELCNEEKDKIFFPIEPNAILGVDLGIRCEMENSVMIDLIRSNLGEKVRIRKAEPDDYEFKIQYVDLK